MTELDNPMRTVPAPRGRLGPCASRIRTVVVKKRLVTGFLLREYVQGFLLHPVQQPEIRNLRPGPEPRISG